MDYKIKSELFEGPYELLYHLIKNSKISIYDVSFVNIIDQYLQYMDKIKEFNPDKFSNFILITSSLLELKSRMLLPNENMIKDKDTIDNTDILETQEINKIFYALEEYKKYKNLAYNLRKMELNESNIYYKNNLKIKTKKNKYDINLLANKYKKFIKPSNEQYKKSKNFSIKQKIYTIIELLRKVKIISFYKLIKYNKTKEDIISCLIAVLELEKRSLVKTSQISNFDDIVIKRGRKNE